MQPHTLLCVIHEEVPLGHPSQEDTRARARLLTELLIKTSRLASPFPICMALTDQTLGLLSSAPSVWTVFQAAVDEHRLELLLTGGVPPLLPMVPAHLRSGMLKEQRLKLTRLQKRAPAGAWLQGLAWDPALLPELRAEDIQYTFLAEGILALGVGGALPSSPLLLAHEGQLLKVLGVSDGGFSVAEASSQLSRVLAGTRDGPIYTVWAPALETLLETPQRLGELLELMAAALEQPALLVPQLPCLWHPRVTWRRYPAPACGIPRLLRERLGTAHQQTQLRIRNVPGKRAPEAGGGAWDRPLDSSAPALVSTWDALVSLYPEADRLYQRMLHFSRQLQQLWTSAERRRLEGDLSAEQARALEQARRQLLSLWHHAYWWPGPAEAPYRRLVRDQFQVGRIRLQQGIDRLLFPEARWVAIEAMGGERLEGQRFLVGSPGLEAVVSTRGGAVSEVCFKPGELALFDFPMRRLEPYHSAILAAGGGTKPRRSAKGQHVGTERHSEQASMLRARLKSDRLPRALFRDLLLRPGATSSSLYSDQAPELVWLGEHEYEVIRTQYERQRGIGTLQLAASCWLDGPGETRSSLRIDKTFSFRDDEGVLEVEITLTNRGHDPLELWYGLECPITLPLKAFETRGGEGPREMRAEAGVGERTGVQSVHFAGRSPGKPLPQAAALPDITASLSATGAPELWWYPFEVLIPSGRSALEVESHGTIYNLIWKHSLWGHEKLRISAILRLELGSGKGESTEMDPMTLQNGRTE